MVNGNGKAIDTTAWEIRQCVFRFKYDGPDATAQQLEDVAMSLMDDETRAFANMAMLSDLYVGPVREDDSVIVTMTYETRTETTYTEHF